MLPRRVELIGAWMVALLASAVASAQQQSAPPTSGGNAADHYRAAFDSAGLGGANGLITEDERNFLIDEVADPQCPSRLDTDWQRRADELMGRLGPVWGELGSGARAPQCDWGLDRSQGFAMLLPHLAPGRQVSGLLLARAQRMMETGERDAAVESLQNLFHIADHASADHILISSLVGGAVCLRAIAGTQNFIDLGVATQEQAAALLQTVDSLGASDPFDFADALRGESDSVAAEVSKPDFPKTLAELVGDDQAAAKRLEGMPPDEVQAQFDRCGEVYERMALAMEEPDPAKARAAVGIIEAEIESSDDSLMKLVMPAVSKALEGKLSVDAELKELRATLAALASGASTAASMANAAVLYQQAGQAAASIGEDRQNTLELVRMLAAMAPEEELAQARKVAQRYERSVLNTLEQAATTPRVRFDPVVAGQTPNLGLLVLPQVRAAVRLVLAEAIAEAAKAPTVTDEELRQRSVFVARRLALALRVAAHIASDRSLNRSMWSASLVQEAVAACEVALERHALDSKGKADVLGALRTNPATDPLGIQESAEADRAALALRGLARESRGALGVGKDSATSRQRAQAAVGSIAVARARMEKLRGLDSEQLLVLALMNDATPETMKALAEAGQLANPADLLTPEAIAAARASVGEAIAKDTLFADGESDVARSTVASALAGARLFEFAAAQASVREQIERLRKQLEAK